MLVQFHYVGTEEQFQADMDKIAADPIVRFWWSYCEPCQEPANWYGPKPSHGGTGKNAKGEGGDWWQPLKQVNHCGGWATSWSDALGPDPNFKPNNKANETSSKDNTAGMKHNRQQGWDSYTSIVTPKKQPPKR